MSKINERLKEERIRLGLSQTSFAKRCGLHRNTLIKYESGERSPDFGFLSSIGDVGIDIPYLYSGIRSADKQMFEIAEIELSKGFYRAFGYSHEDEIAIKYRMMEVLDDEYKNGSGAWDTDDWYKRRSEFVTAVLSESKSSLLSNSIDAKLLSDILTKLENLLINSNVILSPDKKSRVVAMLYRSFAPSGKVDDTVIKEAAALASTFT